MKKIFIIIGVLLFFSGNAFAWDASKNRDQFTDSEWREHEARSERYFRARHPEVYRNYNHNSWNYRYNGYNYRYGNSMRYDRDDYDGCRHGDYRGYQKYKKYDYNYGHRRQYRR